MRNLFGSVSVIVLLWVTLNEAYAAKPFAKTLNINRDVTGKIATLGQVDYYRVTAPSFGTMTTMVSATKGSPLHPKVIVYDGSRELAIIKDVLGPLTIPTKGMVAGNDYIIGVEGSTEDRNGVGKYKIRVEFAEAPFSITAVQFGDGTDQRSLVKQITITFNKTPRFTGGLGDAVSLYRIDGSEILFTANPNGNVITLNNFRGDQSIIGSFEQVAFGSLVDGIWGLLIDAEQVVGSGGELDGVYDGAVGGDYSVSGNMDNKFFRLFGDSNGDGKVDEIDDVAFLEAWTNGQTSVFDYNADGNIDQIDTIEYNNR